MALMVSSCNFTSGVHQGILNAQENIKNQNFTEAIKIYHEVLKNNPSASLKIKIYYQLGDLHSIYLNEYEEAITNYKLVIDSTSDPLWQVRSLERIALISLEQSHDYELAIRSYTKLISFEPKLKKIDEYILNLGKSYFNNKNYPKAEITFQDLIEKYPMPHGVQSYYYLGMIHFYRSEFNLAIKQWFEYLKRENKKDLIVQTKLLIGNAYESQEMLKDAYNIYTSILNDYPNPEVIKRRLDSIYARRVSRRR
jgi:tetratricopeptide (TPR) repeat protein